MQLGKGWHEWYVSTSYVTEALKQLENYGSVNMEKIHILPLTKDSKKDFATSDYLIIYKNED